MPCEEKYDYSGKIHFIENKRQQSFFPIRIINRATQILKIKRLKRKLKVKCTISFLPEADRTNAYSSIGERIIFSIRNNLLADNKLNGVDKKRYSFAVKKCYRIVSITDGIRIQIINKLQLESDKVITIYNPYLPYTTKNTAMNNDRPFIVTMGRLEHQKGQWHLIRAFKYLLEKTNSNVDLVILGKGSLEGYLNSLIDDLNLKERVKLLGFSMDALDIISSSKCFVFPSLYEGLGNSLIEVMGLGVPIISSDCDFGPREILSPESNSEFRVIDKIDYESKCGILVPVCDGTHYTSFDPITKEEILLSNAINTLLENNALRQKIIHNESIRIKDFSLESIGQKWRSLIDEE